MNKETAKRIMDACYQAKRIRDMLPALPGGITSSHINYLDALLKLEDKSDSVKVSEVGDLLGLPRPSVTKTIKDMESLGLIKKETTKTDGRYVYIKTTDKGKEIFNTYVDEFFDGLIKELDDISEEDAKKTIEVIEKVYVVMNSRK